VIESGQKTQIEAAMQLRVSRAPISRVLQNGRSNSAPQSREYQEIA